MSRSKKKIGKLNFFRLYRYNLSREDSKTCRAKKSYARQMS